ncbi:MAG: flagellar hook-length control protein FliK [Rickettsiaceae bacterium]|nr:flagellar hook-length control protein FliK [Rickettsiaceae bacterium]
MSISFISNSNEKTKEYTLTFSAQQTHSDSFSVILSSQSKQDLDHANKAKPDNLQLHQNNNQEKIDNTLETDSDQNTKRSQEESVQSPNSEDLNQELHTKDVVNLLNDYKIEYFNFETTESIEVNFTYNFKDFDLLNGFGDHEIFTTEIANLEQPDLIIAQELQSKVELISNSDIGLPDQAIQTSLNILEDKEIENEVEHANIDEEDYVPYARVDIINRPEFHDQLIIIEKFEKDFTQAFTTANDNQTADIHQIEDDTKEKLLFAPLTLSDNNTNKLEDIATNAHVLKDVPGGPETQNDVNQQEIKNQLQTKVGNKPSVEAKDIRELSTSSAQKIDYENNINSFEQKQRQDTSDFNSQDQYSTQDQFTDNLSLNDFASPEKMKLVSLSNKEEIVQYKEISPANQIKLTVHNLVSENKTQINLQLKPEHLGTVEVKLIVDNGSIKEIKFIAQSQESLDAILKESYILEKTVQEITKDADVRLNFSLGSGQQDNRDKQENIGNFGNSYRSVVQNEEYSPESIITEDQVDVRI